MLDREPVVRAGQTAGGYVASTARSVAWRGWIGLALGVLPSIVFFFGYNQIRFGTPLESGYALATLPQFLQQQRDQGLVLRGPYRDEP